LAASAHRPRPRRAPDLSSTSTADLLAGAGEGDARSWEALVDRFDGLVWRVARDSRLDDASVADLRQIAWLRLWEHRDRITNPEFLGTWLVTTTRREMWQLVRMLDRHPTVDPATLNPPDPAADADRELLADEQRGEVRQALDRIDPRTRAVLVAVSGEARPDYRRIAERIGRPIGSIGPTRRRGLEKLRRELAGVAWR
jgi:RNA polymerase sigma factor (sigma-70 family)